MLSTSLPGKNIVVRPGAAASFVSVPAPMHSSQSTVARAPLRSAGGRSLPPPPLATGSLPPSSRGECDSRRRSSRTPPPEIESVLRRVPKLQSAPGAPRIEKRVVHRYPVPEARAEVHRSRRARRIRLCRRRCQGRSAERGARHDGMTADMNFILLCCRFIVLLLGSCPLRRLVIAMQGCNTSGAANWALRNCPGCMAMVRSLCCSLPAW